MQNRPSEISVAKYAHDAPLRIQLDHLENVGLIELRQFWRRRFKRPLPKLSKRRQLLRQIAWELQQEAFGGLSAEQRRAIREIPTRLRRREFAKTDHALGLRPGTKISRVWREKKYEVTVVEAGFMYLGQRYRTLSAIAERITGIHRSGNAFFGLNEAKIWANARASE